MNKKFAVLGVLSFSGLLLCAPTMTHADSKTSEAVVNVTEAPTTGGIIFLDTDKMNITFENLVVDETTAETIQKNGLAETTKATLKIEDTRKNVKPGQTGYEIKAIMGEGNYGDKAFLKNNMTVSLRPEQAEVPIENTDTVVYKGDYNKANPITELPLNATLKIDNVLNLTDGQYGGQITWTATPEV